jgi:hypothetical protein
MNLKQTFLNQIAAIDKVITERLQNGDATDILPLVEAELMLSEAYEMMDEPEQTWPEGESDDKPEQEEPEERRRKERMEDRGFFSQ